MSVVFPCASGSDVGNESDNKFRRNCHYKSKDYMKKCHPLHFFFVHVEGIRETNVINVSCKPRGVVERNDCGMDS